jgi:hypothetical protein
MKLEESISRTLMPLQEVEFLIVKTLLVPVWKAPPYNYPFANWKRGLYAWSTAVFMVTYKYLIFLD